MTEVKSLARTIARPEAPARVHSINTANFEATPYGARALEDECRAIADSKDGQRNIELNSRAFSIAQLVAGGEIPENEALRELMHAAQSCGMKQREAEQTITSAFKGGMKQPRSAPPKSEQSRRWDRIAGESERDEAAPSDGHAPLVKPSPKAFAFLNSDAIFAELEEPDYLIEQVVRRGSLVEVVAYGSSGKTWIAVDAALAVAAGVPWLGRFPAKSGIVTYFDYENGSFEMRRRLQGVARGRGLALPITGIELCSMPSGYMSDPDFGVRMMAHCKGRDLVIVDTLKAASPGVDENDSSMRNGLDQLRRVGEATGCAFLVLVHSKKTSGSVMAIDAREAGRGSSAIFDAADAVLHISYVEGEPLHLVQTKARTGRTLKPFDVSIEDVSAGFTVWARDAASEEVDRSEHFQRVCDSVVAALKENPGCSARFLRVPVKANPNTIRDALEYLERNGVVREERSGAKATWYFRGSVEGSEDA